MRILMLGNSLTSANQLPRLLARLTGAEVVAHTRGGARLAEHLNPASRMGSRTQEALHRGNWDYVVLQEMSNGPVTSQERFLRSVCLLSQQIREAGATPLLYATWAYADGCPKLAALGLSHEEMARQMAAAFQCAAEEANIPIADAGRLFRETADPASLYAPDGIHPSEAGTRLAAEALTTAMKHPTKEDHP